MNELKVTMENSNINKTYQIINTLNGTDITDKHNSFLNRHTLCIKERKQMFTAYLLATKITYKSQKARFISTWMFHKTTF